MRFSARINPVLRISTPSGVPLREVIHPSARARGRDPYCHVAVRECLDCSSIVGVSISKRLSLACWLGHGAMSMAHVAWRRAPSQPRARGPTQEIGAQAHARIYRRVAGFPSAARPAGNSDTRIILKLYTGSCQGTRGK
eukprot:scaffold76256_cov75-Phaeocystis_antarctica.AAC.2